MAIEKVVESKFIDIVEAPCNPVALYWIDTNGAWNMWVFSGTQTEGVQVEAGEQFERFIEDLSAAKFRSKYISKSEVPKIVLGYSNLETIKVRGVKTILSSINVLMLTSAKDVYPPSFIPVKLLPGSFTIIETENGFHNLEFTIELNELFIQEN